MLVLLLAFSLLLNLLGWGSEPSMAQEFEILLER